LFRAQISNRGRVMELISSVKSLTYSDGGSLRQRRHLFLVV
jgi:hypothetical protein